MTPSSVADILKTGGLSALVIMVLATILMVILPSVKNKTFYFIPLIALMVGLFVFIYTVPDANKVSLPSQSNDTLEPSIFPRESALAVGLKRLVARKMDYQIKLHDLSKGDIYADIYNISINNEMGQVSIEFNYRGGTTLKLNNFQYRTSEAVGSYPIKLPFLGESDVQVKMKFNTDGTADGEWRNMGLGAQFDIVKKFRD